MKHFVVIIKYIVPLNEVEEILPKHRAFLQDGYDAGLILMSGPQNPRTGGIVICRAENIEAIKAVFSIDPYKLNNAAEYSFIEFEPVKFNNLISEWI